MSSIGNVLLLAFGFGFVIFWHELGHFLAAKWADVKVEQFAVGFGQAVFSWRKGLGFRWGSTQTEYQTRAREQVERTLGESLQFKEQAGGATESQVATAAKQLGLSDTEYRLNWIPLGGYVKMLGQDDLRPGIDAPDPRSYTSKSVGRRMVIVSAGVLMNVILAGIGFIVLFSVGYKVPSPTVGTVVPGSPAAGAYRVLASGKHEPAPIVPGDTITYVDGRWQASFDKVRLNTPLLIPGEPVTVELRRVDGRTDEVTVVPVRATADSEFPQLGIAASHALAETDKSVEAVKPPVDKDDELPELTLFKPGDAIEAVDGKPVRPEQFLTLVDALQQKGGVPLPVTIRQADGTVASVLLPAHFESRFGDQAVDFAGLQMLPRVLAVTSDSLFKGKLRPGDVIVDVDTDLSGGHFPLANKDSLFDTAHEAAKVNGRLRFTVLRDGKPTVTDAVEFDRKHANTGVAFDYADADPVIAQPEEGTAAAEARLPAGARLVTVDGHAVGNWFDVWRAMRGVPAGRKFAVTASVDGHVRPFSLRPLTDKEVATIAGNKLTAYAVEALPPAMTLLKGKTLSATAKLGIGETRDAIVQVYLTVRAMVRGGISPKELSGPVGILAVGYKFAQAGATRLLWFLSIISANLAVMNFLPIPVVDGGLFTFLIIEKLKGSPISQRTQVIAQYVGLTLLLSVFLFATWQDLFRLPMLFHG